MMYNIAIKTEESLDYKNMLLEKSVSREMNITNAISHATCTTAKRHRVQRPLLLQQNPIYC